MNPLYDQMKQPSPFSQILQQFQEFRSGFQGNPRAVVEQMLRDGRITQADYDRAVRLANELQRHIK